MVAVNTARPERDRGSVVSLWNLADGKPVTSFTTGQRVSHLEFSPDSRLIAWGGSIGNDGIARLWSTATGAPEAPELPHPNHAGHLRFNHDGRRLVSLISGSPATRDWDTAAGEAMTPPLRLSKGRPVATSGTLMIAFSGLVTGSIPVFRGCCQRLASDAVVSGEERARWSVRVGSDRSLAGMGGGERGPPGQIRRGLHFVGVACFRGPRECCAPQRLIP